MKKIVIALSGGLDSTTLLHYLLEQGYELHCCSFYYGSKHGIEETKSAGNIIEYFKSKKYPVFSYFINLSEVFRGFDSSLLNNKEKIPEGHYQQENMKFTVVPGRNLIFASILAGLAESIGAEHIALGVHAGDHYIYPDCRPNFIYSLNEVIKQSTENKVSVICPFQDKTKIEIVKIGIDLQTPFLLTRTCYTSNEKACGKCGSCIERLEAFKLNNIKDPINYE